MTYATRADLVERFGDAEICQMEHEGVNYEQILTDTDALINGYLARSYQVPLTNPSALLVGWACDIARYKIRSRTIRGSDALSEDIRKRYEDVLKQLKDAADGLIVLDLTVTPTDANNATTRVSGRADTAEFTKERGLYGWE